MNIKQGFPPNIEKIRALFPEIESRVVFTYGEDLYIQDNKEEALPQHLMVHEQTHTLQQQGDPEAWWDLYLSSREFRLSQELEAYGRQYKWVKETARNGDRWLKQALFFFAEELSGPMCGTLIGFSEAESKIRNAAKNALV